MIIKDGIEKTDGMPISFLMIGQSNMAGRGDIGDVEPIRNDLCYMLRMGRWQPMSEPINVDRGDAAKFLPGIGLAASFADAVSKYENSPVGLIPCADGGTAIRQWLPGEVLFDHALMMAKLAMRSSHFGGIIWHQGENDCISFDKDKYRRDFLCVMNTMRKELNAEGLPLIIGELSRNISEERWHFGDAPLKINSLLAELQYELPNCALASSEGLTLRNDGIHFNAKSCRIFGIRYFEKYREIREKK